MPVMIGPQTVVMPLSLAAFEKERQIVGRIEDCTYGPDGSYIGRLLVADRGEAHYSHPTLFRDTAFIDRTHGWVLVSLNHDLAGTGLSMQGWDREARSVVLGHDLRVGPVVTLAQASVEAVLELERAIQRRDRRCKNPQCDGARDRDLDLRRTVLFVGSGVRAECAHCFDRIAERRDVAPSLLIFDGRLLPWHAPVSTLVPSTI